MFLSQFDMLFTLRVRCVHEVRWTKSNLWGLVREKCFVFCFCSVLSREELSSDHVSHEKLCHWNTCQTYLLHEGLRHWNTCHMKSYVTGTLVTWKDVSQEHLSHEKLCHWNTCHMKRYVTGTHITWKVMSLEHLSHEKLCHWNTCHMIRCHWNTCHMKVMSLEQLSHESYHWNTCHMKSYVTGTLVTWKDMSLDH